MTTTVDDVEQRLRVALDATIPLLLVRPQSAGQAGPATAERGPLLEPVELVVDQRSPLRRTMLTAAVLLLLAGTGGLIAIQGGPNDTGTTDSSIEPTAATQPHDPGLREVLDRLPGDSWVAVAVQPGAQQLDAYDTAGRRVWFSYVTSPEDLVPGDLDDDGSKVVRDENVGDGVVTNCFLDRVDRVACNTSDHGLPAISEEDLASAGSKMLPLLREGNDGLLGDLVNSTTSPVDGVEAEQLLAQALGDESVSVMITPGVVTDLQIGVPLSLTAPDGSSVVSVVDRFGLLYRVRTGADIDVTKVLQTIPRLLGMASDGSAPPMTTLPLEQP